MKKMKRMAALILSCALAAVCPVMGSQAEEDTRKDFVFGDYVGDVDPASGAYAWVGMRIGVMESLFKLDDSMTVQKNLVDDYSVFYAVYVHISTPKSFIISAILTKRPL